MKTIVENYSSIVGTILGVGFFIGLIWLTCIDERTPWEIWKERRRR